MNIYLARHLIKLTLEFQQSKDSEMHRIKRLFRIGQSNNIIQSNKNIVKPYKAEIKSQQVDAENEKIVTSNGKSYPLKIAEVLKGISDTINKLEIEIPALEKTIEQKNIKKTDIISKIERYSVDDNLIKLINEIEQDMANLKLIQDNRQNCIRKTEFLKIIIEQMNDHVILKELYSSNIVVTILILEDKKERALLSSLISEMGNQFGNFKLRFHYQSKELRVSRGN